MSQVNIDPHHVRRGKSGAQALLTRELISLAGQQIRHWKQSAEWSVDPPSPPHQTVGAQHALAAGLISAAHRCMQKYKTISPAAALGPAAHPTGTPRCTWRNEQSSGVQDSNVQSNTHSPAAAPRSAAHGTGTPRGAWRRPRSAPATACARGRWTTRPAPAEQFNAWKICVCCVRVHVHEGGHARERHPSLQPLHPQQVHRRQASWAHWVGSPLLIINSMFLTAAVRTAAGFQLGSIWVLNCWQHAPPAPAPPPFLSARAR